MVVQSSFRKLAILRDVQNREPADRKCDKMHPGERMQVKLWIGVKRNVCTF